MVIHHNHIEGEAGLLFHCTLHGIGNGLFAVENRNNQRSLVGELLFLEVGFQIIVCIHDGTDSLQMVGGGFLHLNLHLTV